MLDFFRNQRADLIQKAAWRLVRSARDRFPTMAGAEKLAWCVDRLKESFPREKGLEDYIRAAYVNFAVETGVFERRVQ